MGPADYAEQEFALKKTNKALIKEPRAFDRYAGGRPEHWCAHFVSWLFWKSGIPLPGWFPPTAERMPPTANCTYLYDTLDSMGLTYSTPKRHDMIFYKHSNPKYSAAHIGIVTNVDQRAGTVTTIEGNVSDQVVRITRKLSDNRILGYGRFYHPAVPVVGGLALAGAVWFAYRRIKAKGKK